MAGRKKARRSPPRRSEPGKRSTPARGRKRSDQRAARLETPNARTTADEVPRRDDSGQVWSREDVEREVRVIVAQLSRLDTDAVRTTTRFGDDLSWDDWFVLSVVKPIRARLHETLSDFILLQLETVGDLVNYVWSRMEVVT